MKRLLIVGLVVLTILNIVSFGNSISAREQLASLQSEVAKLPKSPVVYNGVNGYTPRKGIDYNDGANGANGLNAISFNTILVKEVPLTGVPGIDGRNGIDGENAPTQQIRINPDNGNFETKLSNERVWFVQTECADLAVIWKIECPSAD